MYFYGYFGFALLEMGKSVFETKLQGFLYEKNMNISGSW